MLIFEGGLLSLYSTKILIHRDELMFIFLGTPGQATAVELTLA